MPVSREIAIEQPVFFPQLAISSEKAASIAFPMLTAHGHNISTIVGGAAEAMSDPDNPLSSLALRVAATDVVLMSAQAHLQHFLQTQDHADPAIAFNLANQTIAKLYRDHFYTHQIGLSDETTDPAWAKLVLATKRHLAHASYGVNKNGAAGTADYRAALNFDELAKQVAAAMVRRHAVAIPILNDFATSKFDFDETMLSHSR